MKSEPWPMSFFAFWAGVGVAVLAMILVGAFGGCHPHHVPPPLPTPSFTASEPPSSTVTPLPWAGQTMSDTP